jgi:hypothetical protein
MHAGEKLEDFEFRAAFFGLLKYPDLFLGICAAVPVQNCSTKTSADDS